LDKSDPTLLTYFNRNLGDKLQGFSTSLEGNLGIASINYYDKNPYPKSFPVDIVNPQVTYNLDLLFMAPPLYDLARDAVIFYHNGDTEHNKSEGNTTDPKYKWDSFIPSDGNLQYFYSSVMFQSIFDDVVIERIFNLTVTEATLPKVHPFRLNINYLGRVIPAIYNVYPRDDDVFANATITNMTLFPRNNNLDGHVTLLFKVVHASNLEEILIFETIFKYTLTHSYKDHQLNLRFITLDLNHRSVLKKQYGLLNLMVLRDWVSTSLQDYIQKNEYNLLVDPIDLSSIYTVSNARFIPENGILVYGNAKTAKKYFD